MSRSASRRSWALGVALLLTTGCYQGHADHDADSSGADDEDAAEDEGGGIDAECGEGPMARTAPLRRMTDIQYHNTIEDLFGGAVVASEAFPLTLGSSPYGSYPEANHVSQLGAEAILIAAEDVAAQAVEALPSILPCAGTGDESACADELLDTVGRRAFRRPLHDDERTLLRDLYDASRSETTFEDAVGRVIAAMLQMPQFLYFVEEGTPTDEPGVVRLTEWELATRLSYLLWDTMPDDELLDAAESGALATREDIEAQARRLLADDRATGVMTRFTQQWLHTGHLSVADKDTTAFPQFDETLIAAMEEEFDHFVAAAYRSGEGSLQTLLTGRETVVNAPLASLYGVDAGSAGPDDWRSVTLPDERAGVLTLPAVIAANSSAATTNPIFRGEMLRVQTLCQDLPPPPADLEVPEFPVDATEREKSEILMNNPECGGCHTLMNPLGLSFEHYDAIGAFREQDEHGNAIDARGELISGPGDLEGEFDGAPEYAQMLAASDETAACMTTQWMRYTYGRRETSDERCVVDSLTDHFIESGYDLQELLVAFTQTEGFRFRRLEGDQ